MKNTCWKYLLAWVALLPALLLCNACKDDDDKLPANQGQVCFSFVRTAHYTLNGLDDICSVIITVQKDGVRRTLPSQSLTGDENIISTPLVALEEGTWQVVAYRAFDSNGALIELLDVTLSKDNEFTITAGAQTSFELPVRVKQIVSLNNFFNILYGLCTEVLGEDQSKWPPSWDFESGTIDETWAGLEFALDDYGYPSTLAGIVFDGEPKMVMDMDGNWKNMSLTEFKHMKKLPAFVFNLVSLTQLSFRNCDLEELPEEIGNSAVATLSLENTHVSRLPQSMGTMKGLYNVYLMGNRFTEFPTCLTQAPNIYQLHIVNEQIPSLPEGIGNWSKLRSLVVNGTNISAVPDVFDRLCKISTLDLSNNPALNTLPESLRPITVAYPGGGYSRKSLRAVYLDGCSFTAIPPQLARQDIRTLYLRNNRITSVGKEELEAMTDLGTLVLDGNALTAFPQVNSTSLTMLSLIGCGLQRQQIDVSGLPNLNPDYLFMTEADWDRMMHSSVDDLLKAAQ